jgi:hypothetical protein
MCIQLKTSSKEVTGRARQKTITGTVCGVEEGEAIRPRFLHVIAGVVRLGKAGRMGYALGDVSLREKAYVREQRIICRRNWTGEGRKM